MYRLFIFILLSAISMPVLASRTVVTQTPYNPYYGAYYGGDYIPKYQRAKYSSIFPDINDLEKYALNKNYTKDGDRIRLERLESYAFGAIQEGDVYTRYNNVREAILSRPKQNYKTSILRNISDYLGGQLTGYTPSITSTNSAFPSNSYGRTYTNEYITPWGKGYHTRNYGTGSGCGVHILD